MPSTEKSGCRAKTNPQKKVAALAAACASFALASQTDALTFMHAARNFHLIGLHLFGAAAAERNLAGWTRASASSSVTMSRLRRRARVRMPVVVGRNPPPKADSSPPSAEKCFEEIAETSAAEFELYPAVAAAGALKTATGPPRPHPGGG